MKSLYPIYLDMDQRNTLVIGGGLVASRKVKTLLNSGAIVKVISPRFEDELREMARDNSNLTLTEKEFEESDLADAALIIAATDDNKINQDVSRLAREKGMWINVVDDPILCNFFMPALVTRGDLTIAVSTGGKCPAMAKKARKLIEAQFDPIFEKLLNHLAEARIKLLHKYPNDLKKRGEIMNKIVDSGIVEKIPDITESEIIEEINRWL